MKKKALIITLLLSVVILGFGLEAGHSNSLLTLYKNPDFKAGKVWAKDNNIIDMQKCPEKSEAFTKGCMSYVAERTR